MIKLYNNLDQLLFEKDESKETINAFHPEKWKQMDSKDRINAVFHLNKCIDDIFKLDYRPIEFGKESTSISTFNPQDKKIWLSPQTLETDNGLDILRIFLHEKRHQVQDEAIRNSEKFKNDIDKTQIKGWQRNIYSDTFYGIHNYFPLSGEVSKENASIYYIQPIERDAYESSDILTYKIIKRLINSNKEIEEFAYFIESILYNMKKMIKNEDEYIRLTNIMEKRWIQNDKDIKKSKKNLAWLEKEFGEIEKIKDEKIYKFFQPFFYDSLSIQNKKKLLENFDNYMVEKYNTLPLSINIIEEENKLELEGATIESDSIDNSSFVIARYLEESFYVNLDKLLETKNDSLNKRQRKIKREILLERFLATKDKDFFNNLFDTVLKSSFLPSQKYLNEFAFEKYKPLLEHASFDLKDIDKKEPGFFAGLNIILNRFDNKTIEKASEKLYGKGFVEVYEENMEKFKKRYAKINNKSKSK